jgi:hypothetical protein
LRTLCIYCYLTSCTSFLCHQVRFSAASHDWEPGMTHVVLPFLKRSDKAMCAMAAGAWLLREAWLRDSKSAGKLVGTEEYELESSGGGGGTIISNGARV